MATSKKVSVALYARCSTLDQKADLQIDALRQLAEQRGWNVVGEFVDLGVSGAKDRRPKLDEMLGLVCWLRDLFRRNRQVLNSE